MQWRIGLSGNHAAELVRIARRSTALPQCTAALRDGTMSLDQLDVVARNVPDHYDADVVDIAQMSTVAQLNRALSKMPFTDEPDTPPPPPIHEVRTNTDRHGRYHLRACGPADHGAIIDRALQEARDALFHAGQTDVTDWEALVEIAQRSLDTITTPTRRDRYRAYVHLDTNDHRAHHAGELSITGNPEQPDGLIFRNRHGIPILGPQPKPPDHHPPPGQPYPGPTGETFHTLWWNIPDRPPPNAA